MLQEERSAGTCVAKLAWADFLVDFLGKLVYFLKRFGASCSFFFFKETKINHKNLSFDRQFSQKGACGGGKREKCRKREKCSDF